LFPVCTATPSIVSPFCKSDDKVTLPVVATRHIILVFNPATKLSVYVFVAGSLPALGEPKPEICPPVILTLLLACVLIVPKPRFVLAVDDDVRSLRLFYFTALASSDV